MYFFLKLLISCGILGLFLFLRTYDRPRQINEEVYQEVFQAGDSNLSARAPLATAPVSADSANTNAAPASGTKQPRELPKTASGDDEGALKPLLYAMADTTPYIFINDKNILTTQNSRMGLYRLLMTANGAIVFYADISKAHASYNLETNSMKRMSDVPFANFSATDIRTTGDIDINIDPEGTFLNAPAASAETAEGNTASNSRDTVTKQLTFLGRRIRLGQSVYKGVYMNIVADSLIITDAVLSHVKIDIGKAAPSHRTKVHFINTTLDSVNIRGFLDSAYFTNVTSNTTFSVATGQFCSLHKMQGSGQIRLRQSPEHLQKTELARNRALAKYGSVQSLDTMLRTKVLLNETDISKLHFDSRNYLFIVDTNQSFESQVVIYNQLLTRFDRIKSERKLYDIPFQKLINKHDGNHMRNFLAEQWDNYGYDPNRIFMFALSVFILLCCINLPMYPFAAPRVRDQQFCREARPYRLLSACQKTAV